ncbi:peroxiredoxin [Lutibaculum baratangense]|uniref:Glutathione-dependent peroxiredoxin n=1 Tax=Lutibaculum baratangense AMV1 TaxID=631454 RepID=V4RFK6_9HYPH|nr:peroxiredoxin [Lutibaculum baratangense]ESR24926.1 Peroxiredoxin [Lutibaculum baratangense AMV1]
MIKIGDSLPETTFWVMGPEGPQETTTSSYFGGRRIAVVGIPGAFSPTCQERHLPTFIERHDDLLAKGIDAVACIAVNDAFVLAAWSRATGAEGKIDFLADGNAEFARATGLDNDVTSRGQGVRSKRYAMVVDNGEVKDLRVEETPRDTAVSTADQLLSAL